MSFDHTKIKEVKINFSQPWNPETHTIVLCSDGKSSTGFSVRSVPVAALNDEVSDTAQATEVLNKFRLH